MKKRFWIFIIALFVVAGLIFYLYDYSKDVAVKKSEDLYKTVINRGYLIVGVKNDVKPFGFVEGGKNVGYDIDIAHYIAKEILHDENKVKFIPVSDSERMYVLNSGKVDMIIATMTITNQRQHFSDFSKAYYITGQALLVRTGSPIRSLSDLADKNVGVIFGSTAEQTIKFLLPTAKVLGYRTYQQAYTALKNGTVLAVVADDAIIRTYSLKDGGVHILPKHYTRDSYGIAFRRGSESEYMLNIVNNIISLMDSQGVFNELRKKWNLN